MPRGMTSIHTKVGVTRGISATQSFQDPVRLAETPNDPSNRLVKLHFICGKKSDPIAALVHQLDQKTTQWYIYLMPKHKREAMNSIPFEF